jgi:hypothetical protein
MKMEIIDVEVSVIENTQSAAFESQTIELSGMQLALVGGGNMILGFN